MELPVGSIVIWGAGNIPDGFQLCDGTNGTPDLRGVFVKGAQDDDDLLGTGGVSSHTHTNPNTSTRSDHRHSISGTTGVASDHEYTATGGSSTPTARSHTHAWSGNTGYANAHSHTVGNSGSASNLPPHIKLYFIMRME